MTCISTLISEVTLIDLLQIILGASTEYFPVVSVNVLIIVDYPYKWQKVVAELEYFITL